jgi:tetratricopeptide (TPR) repeat protein
MMMEDGFGAPVSYHDRKAVESLHAAATSYLGYQKDPAATIGKVLDEHPDFIMARCFLAGLFLTASDKRYQPKLAAQFALLGALANNANSRERGHIRAISLWLSGDLHAASQAYADILAEHPRDLCALQFGHQTDFLLGVASSTRDRPARVLKHWSERDPEFSFVLGMLAFGLEECGHYRQAEETALRAIALNPRDTWAVHALAHCYEMQGLVETGIGFMSKAEEYWAGDNYMAIHNRWHYCLYLLERCEFEAALACHDGHMIVGSDSALMDMHDSVAMLWRLTLYGIDCADRWETLATRYAEVIDQAYMSFTDLHAIMAFLAAGRRTEADALIAVLNANAGGTKTTSLIIRAVGLDLIRGMRAFWDGEHDLAKALLGRVRHSAHMIGGSIAQRDVINLTLMESAIRSRDKGLVEALIAERCLMKTESPLTQRFHDRLARNLGH